jgi:precorrin-3B synthase
LAKAGLAKAELVSQPDGARPPPPPVVVGALPGGVLGVAPPFGQIGAEQLAALAGLAERLGDGTLRVTPWRALLLPGVADAAAVARLGLIVTPGDPRLRIVACTGAPGCASAAIDTRAVAARLAQAWAMKAGTGAMEAGPAGAAPDKGRADQRPGGARPAGLLHVSGCAKGCAHPGVAPVTLVGHAHGCGIVRDGRAGDTPDATDLTLEEALAVLENP